MLALYNGFVPASSTTAPVKPPATSTSTSTSATTSKPATQTVTRPATVSTASTSDDDFCWTDPEPEPTTTFATSTKPVTTPKPSSTKASTTSSVISTPTASWTDLGCYTDSTSSRGLPVSVTVSGGVTPSSCRNSCSAKGYSIAGVEYGTECWCGNTLGKSSVKTNEGDCNMKCTADASQICGLYMCQQTNWGPSCQNLAVGHSESCAKPKNTPYYHNFRSAGPDQGSCLLFAGDDCNASSETYGSLAYPGVTTFGSQNAHWGSVRCFP
ncbi:hypothetical protein OQA88_8703 [Cercophora sp. LCS_1]